MSTPSCPPPDPPASLDLPVSTTDHEFLQHRLGPVRTREVLTVLAEISEPARDEFIESLRGVDPDMPSGPALLLGLARFCDTLADAACKATDGPDDPLD